MPEADKALYFTIDEKNNSIELTEKGIDLITGDGEDPALLYYARYWQRSGRPGKQSLRLAMKKSLLKKMSLSAIMLVKSQRIHTVNQLLKAYTLFEKDTEVYSYRRKSKNCR